MNAHELLKKREMLKQIDSKIRGEYLLTISYLEQRVDHILADYFCKKRKKHDLLLELVIGSKDLTFAKKTRILEKIVKTVFPQFYKDHETIFKTIDSLRDFRNKLAHQPPELRLSEVPNRNEDEIVLLYFKNGKENKESYKISVIKRKIRTATALLVADLSVLQKLVKR